MSVVFNFPHFTSAFRSARRHQPREKRKDEGKKKCVKGKNPSFYLFKRKGGERGRGREGIEGGGEKKSVLFLYLPLH